jgi:hypothetical protein
MTSTEQFVALHPDAQERLLRIADLGSGMTPEERASASQIFATITRTYALLGADIDIPAAQMLGELIDLLLIASREERRATEREAV